MLGWRTIHLLKKATANTNLCGIVCMSVCVSFFFSFFFHHFSFVYGMHVSDCPCGWHIKVVLPFLLNQPMPKINIFRGQHARDKQYWGTHFFPRCHFNSTKEHVSGVAYGHKTSEVASRPSHFFFVGYNDTVIFVHIPKFRVYTEHPFRKRKKKKNNKRIKCYVIGKRQMAMTKRFRSLWIGHRDNTDTYRMKEKDMNDAIGYRGDTWNNGLIQFKISFDSNHLAETDKMHPQEEAHNKNNKINSCCNRCRWGGIAMAYLSIWLLAAALALDRNWC